MVSTVTADSVRLVSTSEEETMRQRTIKINISPTVNRKKFDAELSHDGLTSYIENKTRGEIHDLIREATNQAFDSFD